MLNLTKLNTKCPGDMGYHEKNNLRIIGIEEVQLKGTENIFNKNIEENFPNLKKDMPMKVQEA